MPQLSSIVLFNMWLEKEAIIFRVILYSPGCLDIVELILIVNGYVLKLHKNMGEALTDSHWMIAEPAFYINEEIGIKV